MYPHQCECGICGRGIPDTEGYGGYDKIEQCRNCRQWIPYRAEHRCPKVAPGQLCGGKRTKYGLIQHRGHKWGDYCPMLCVRCDVPYGTKGVVCLTADTNPINETCDCGKKRRKGNENL